MSQAIDLAARLGRIRIQISISLFILLLYLLEASGTIPTRDQLIGTGTALVRAYGPLIVAPLSFVENLGGLNVYFPGSVAILSAMALSAGNPTQAVETFLAIVIPSFCAHQLNYYSGKRLGRNRRSDRYKTKVGAHIVFATTAWHPHFLALSCMDAGARGMSYGRFVSFFSPWFLVWNLFWGILMYNFGALISGESLGLPVIFAIITIWALWDYLDAGGMIRKKFRSKPAITPIAGQE